MPKDDDLHVFPDQLDSDDVFDSLPSEVLTDEEKIALLLDLLAAGFVGDADLDLVRDAALCGLLRFEHLPDRTIAIMLAILAVEDDSDIVLARKAAAANVLKHIGPRANPALQRLTALLSLVESGNVLERVLALRASRAIWQITGDPESAVDVAEKLIEDDEFWLVIHATESLREIDSVM